MARPTKYQEAYAEQARKLCLLGYTDAELADFFEVSESTINKWKLDYPEFSKKKKKGDIFTENNITTKRPGNGISPMRWYDVLGKKARRDFEEDELIEL